MEDTTRNLPGTEETKQDLPILEFEHQDAWEQWLEENHASSAGVWLKLAKKSAPRATVSYADAVDVALAFGWIDSQKARYDEHFSLQRFTRRGPRSKWSQINCHKAEKLIADKRMKPPGLAEVRRAQQDGRWDAAYPAQSQATVPDDFRTALDENPQAKAFFETLTGATRYAFLFRLHNVKREQTRRKRIANYIDLLNDEKTLSD
jgi:uncharacterized protein YdeI (YjbR/CyaY-like superfamily)